MVRLARLSFLQPQLLFSSSLAEMLMKGSRVEAMPNCADATAPVRRPYRGWEVCS